MILLNHNVKILCGPLSYAPREETNQQICTTTTDPQDPISCAQSVRHNKGSKVYLANVELLPFRVPLKYNSVFFLLLIFFFLSRPNIFYLFFSFFFIMFLIDYKTNEINIKHVVCICLQFTEKEFSNSINTTIQCTKDFNVF